MRALDVYKILLENEKEASYRHESVVEWLEKTIKKIEEKESKNENI